MKKTRENGGLGPVTEWASSRFASADELAARSEAEAILRSRSLRPSDKADGRRRRKAAESLFCYRLLVPRIHACGFLAGLQVLMVLGSSGCCRPKTFQVQVWPTDELQHVHAVPLSVLFAPKTMADRYGGTKASEWFKSGGAREKLLNTELNDPEKKKLLFTTQARPGRREYHPPCGPFPESIQQIVIWAAVPGNKESLPHTVDPATLKNSGFWPFCSRQGLLKIEVGPNEIKCEKGEEEP